MSGALLGRVQRTWARHGPNPRPRRVRARVVRRHRSAHPRRSLGDRAGGEGARDAAVRPSPGCAMSCAARRPVSCCGAGGRGSMIPRSGGRWPTRRCRSGRTSPVGSTRRRLSALRDGRVISDPIAGRAPARSAQRTPKTAATSSSASGACSRQGRKAFVSQLKALQDNLGLHQDAEVQAAELRALAHDLRDRNKVDTDALLVVGRLIDHRERVRPAEKDGRVLRPLPRLRHRAEPDSAPTRSCQAASCEGRRHLQHQGRCREDDHGRQPRVRGVPRRRSGPRLGPRSARQRHLLRARPKVKGGSKRLVGSQGELAAHIRGTAQPSVHVVPADFSLRHLDLHLKRTKDPTTRLAGLLEPLRDHYDLALLDCPPSISLASESVFGPPMRSSSRSCPPRSPAARWSSSPTSSPIGPTRRRSCHCCPMVDRRRTLHRELVEELTADWPQLLRPDSRRRGDRAHGRRTGGRRGLRPGRAARRPTAPCGAELAGILWASTCRPSPAPAVRSRSHGR